MTHTPGPWLQEGTTVYALDETGRVNRFWTAVQVGKLTYRGDMTSKAELEANARLIAAAPDLLAALQAAMHILGRQRLTPSAIIRYEQARAAITKATNGETTP